MTFRNRREAGKELADELYNYARQKDVIVLGLPRGGVPLAAEVSKKLQVSMDICLVRKLGVPWNPELAFGAIAMGGVLVLNENVLRTADVQDEDIEAIAQEEKEEIERRNKLFRGNRPVPELENKIVIIVDDGLATGATMKAAVKAIKAMRARKIVVAVPVSSKQALEEIRTQVDEVICLNAPEMFHAVSQWYEDFPQVSDQEVQDILNEYPGSMAA
jgi:putative phosphoribosyl transferase